MSETLKDNEPVTEFYGGTKVHTYLYKGDFLLSLDSLLSHVGDSSQYAAEKIMKAVLWSDNLRRALVEEIIWNGDTGSQNQKRFRLMDSLREALVEKLDWIGKQLVEDLLRDKAQLEREVSDLKDNIQELKTQWPTGFEKYMPKFTTTTGWGCCLPDIQKLIEMTAVKVEEEAPL